MSVLLLCLRPPGVVMVSMELIVSHALNTTLTLAMEMDRLNAFSTRFTNNGEFCSAEMESTEMAHVCVMITLMEPHASCVLKTINLEITVLKVNTKCCSGKIYINRNMHF